MLWLERFATRLVEVWEQSAEIVEQNVAEILEEQLHVNSQARCAECVPWLDTAGSVKVGWRFVQTLFVFPRLEQFES